MIKLGLGRISLLAYLDGQHLWKTVHVAGTNGKGSICAYISRLLRLDGSRKVGEFTSPALIDAWDGIKLQGKPVSEQAFSDACKTVLLVDACKNIQATEFERMTAAAIEIFQREHVDYAVVEAGLGGATDATNVLENKAVTVISKIGLDHQELLGGTVGEIARNKAGIMRKGVPCVVDSSNPPEVMKVLRRHAREVGTEITVASVPPGLETRLLRRGLPPHKIQNMACAIYAYYHLLQGQQPPSPQPTSPLLLLRSIQHMTVPGRLQKIDLGGLTAHRAKAEALLDGAHNAQSAEALAAYVDKHLRGPEGRGGVTWVLAMSAGKDHDAIIKTILRPQDNVAATEFDKLPDMPWVKPEKAGRNPALAHRPGFGGSRWVLPDPMDAVRAALSRKEPIVIAGSLYLVRHVLRELRRLRQHEVG
ncbi:folylpolyglutamate synthase [Magnaporthiopsis poae ATCC 64411]|uniref:Folylpolyglutamate synthase n=1 Tax=Magnaporthiopsis poae (strain ATCC 64411 / 73-15) TaxID=644358 RepID=A0A0C4DSM0_MAGP6|nr:folylpolyglutamate synthase [Magnaporthiopsis poae ATCC 64411]